jgi:hypothetical protein
MKSIKIKLTVSGTWCHDWPKMKILLNNIIYYDDQVTDTIDVVFEAPLQDNNSLIIQHYDKKFGQNGQWDTKLVNDVIVQDRALKLHSLDLDNVSITKYVIEYCPFVSEQGEKIIPIVSQ